ncbi:MAG: DUF1592 domain-containing protein [Pseudobdellovibrionaceae bacterium]
MDAFKKRKYIGFSVGSLVGLALVVSFNACKGGGFLLEEKVSLSSRASGLSSLDTSTVGLCGVDYKAGRTTIHRLTNEEYNNTVRDLLFTNLHPADAFPTSSIGYSGYTNDSDALKTYAELVSDYYNAAEALANNVLSSKSVQGGAYSKIAGCALSTNVNIQTCATNTVQQLATRAFRRPLSSGEVSQLMTVFNQSGNFDMGLGDVITSILMSPKFLFVSIVSPQSRINGAEFNISEYELASRLSYFLWQSMPDDELMSLASKNQLHTSEILKQQVQRMLKDAKVDSFLKILRNEYLNLSNLANFSVPTLDDNLRLSMVQETDLFLQDLVANDRSLLNIVNGSYTFVNKALADLYGIAFNGNSPSDFVKVTSAATNRIGVGTQASVLTATAGEVSVTHPVKRGKWVTNRILCAEPPPPPPGIAPINLDPTAPGGSIRDRLIAHANNPSCFGCHEVMDNVGLGLENYDPFGRWRTSYLSSGTAIDATGVLPDKSTFATPQEMYQHLAQSDQVHACLPQQMMAYALTRAVESADDHCVAKALGISYVGAYTKLSDLVAGIVFSNQFQKQTGEAP